MKVYIAGGSGMLASVDREQWVLLERSEGWSLISLLGQNGGHTE